MRLPVELGEATAPSLLDGALAFALSTGAPLRLVGPLNGADAAVVMAAARIGDAERLDATRGALGRTGPVELTLGHPRAGVHVLELREDGAVPRALWALAWPLALLGRPSELRLSGPNHCEGLATFHDLRLGWVPLAARFGLKVALELPLAGFDDENGEMIAALDPAPALTPLQLVHRGILRQVTVVAATAQGRDEEPLRAAQAAARRLRVHGVIAEPERVPLPHPQGSRGGRWSLTAVAEFQNSVFTASALGARRERPELLGPQPKSPPEEAGERVAERLRRVLAAGGGPRRRHAGAPLGAALPLPAGPGARRGGAPPRRLT